MAYCPGTLTLCFDWSKSFLTWSRCKILQSKKLACFQMLKKTKKTSSNLVWKLRLESVGICMHDLQTVIRLLLLFLIIKMLVFLFVWTFLSGSTRQNGHCCFLIDLMGWEMLPLEINSSFCRYQRTDKSGWLIPVAITMSSSTIGEKVRFEKSSI